MIQTKAIIFLLPQDHCIIHHHLLRISEHGLGYLANSVRVIWYLQGGSFHTNTGHSLFERQTDTNIFSLSAAFLQLFLIQQWKNFIQYSAPFQRRDLLTYVHFERHICCTSRIISRQVNQSAVVSYEKRKQEAGQLEITTLGKTPKAASTCN